ncbi:MAG: hypothetical protein E6K70_13465 [Planctomycetota bacterium]|nr:MAG: hypothetical protein E6K70_13465 [Planctomycetota bacterium]
MGQPARIAPELRRLDAIRKGAEAIGPRKGVWNFQALKTPAFSEAREFQTPFFGQSGQERIDLRPARQDNQGACMGKFFDRH